MVVSGRLMFVLLVAVTIVISRGQVAPSTGLYFTLSGTVYLPNDTILITDIGSNTTNDRSDPQSSLVCVTTNVNTECCRGTDNPNGGGRGEWYLPDGTRLMYKTGDNFYRARYNQQVRLYRNSAAMSPTGVFACEVPNEANSTILHMATITIVNVTLTESEGTPTEGENYMLTCTVSGGGSMAYAYMWLKDGSVVSGQTSSTYSFSPLSVTDSGRYSCRVRVGSTAMTTSRNVTITVVAVTTEEPSITTPTTTVATAIPPLTVRIVNSGSTLTCETSGGVSMAYTYMWLRNGGIVSGQTSSTYSFSPPMESDSGQYKCRVSVGSMTVTSEGVDITVERTDTQLYFTWRGDRYEPGDSILITDIRLHDGDSGPANSLVCNTTAVNTQCCTDRGDVGEWFFPNGSMVLRNFNTGSDTPVIRTGRTNQLRLNFRRHPTSLTGEYTCVVPETGGSVIQTAGIRLVTDLPQLNVTLTGSGGTPTVGQDYMLTCTASGGGSMAYTYMWLRNGSVVSGQTSSTYSFSPLRRTDSGQYSCRVRVGSMTMNTSGEVTITVVAVTTEEPSTSPPPTTVPATIPPLTVRIVSSRGTLRAGQNHVLTCEASGGGSMAYTYMWLKDGSVASGQTSSTYSFSPLLVVHSGQYSCRVIVGTMNVTSDGVDITVAGTDTQLYFTWRGNRYGPGDSILITDIGLHHGDAGPGDSLVCVTTDVNTGCCTDIGGVGEWFLPNGNMVPRNIDDPNRNSQIIRTGRTNQVRLNFRNHQTSPTGEYTCVVPETDGSVNQTAGIRLVTELPQLNVMLTGSGGTLTEGQNHMLTCEASGGGSMAYTYMWLKDGSVVSGQTSSTYSFSPLRLTDSGRYNCRVSLGSTNMMSEAVTIAIIHAVPNPPSNLTATMHTATCITITWTETTTTNIDRYEVMYSYTVRRCSATPGPAMRNTVTNTTRSHTLMNLNEDSTYTITVKNINGEASNMSTITANTSTTVPSAGPSSVTPTTVGTTSITIEWSEVDCTDRNGVITGYRVRYGPTSTTPSQRQIANISDPGRRMFTVDREFITLSYDFEVAAVNVNGTGPYSTPPLTVDTAVPSGLGFYLNGMAYSNNSVVTITDIGEGDMSLYCITSRSECCRSSDGGERGDWFLPGQDNAVKGTSTNDFSRRREPRAVILERRNSAVSPIGLYRCEIPDAGDTLQSLYIGVYTNDRVSGPVSDLQTNSPDDYTLVISWRPPTIPNGEIISYTVRIENLTDETTLRYIMDHNATMTNLTENDLVAGVPYRVSVAAVNLVGQGSITTLTNFTKELEPSISPRNVSITRTSPTVMEVSWIPLTLSEARGFITSYTVFYSPQVSRTKRQEPNTMQKTVSGNVSQTTIHDLDPNTAYDVQMSANTKAGASSMSNVTSAPVPITGDGGGGGGGGGAVIGVVVGLLIAVLLVVVIVIAIIIFIRYRRGTEAKYSTAQKNSVRHHNKNTAQAMPLKESNEMKELEANEQNYENTEFIARERLKPIPVDKFAQHVQRMHADRDRQFELEYNSIEKSPQADYEAAVIPKNKARNRFGNIFPYDFNRVILKRKPGEENSDYINASYIDGYRRKKVYIGSQGPTENSLEDFWRMIWEQRVPTIVMLTRIFEGRKKCEEYWPENVDTPFVPVPDSPLSIQYDSVLPFPEFIIRKMTVTNSDEPGTPPLTVTLYHYLGWPDHGVPVNAISMVNFVKRVRKNHPYSKEDLLLVHCSAGVGRTGTFITLDSMLERINVEKSINILEFVSNLRKQRVLMVQTVVQYVFIHNALDELLTCGETEISAANMRIVIGKLSRPSEGQKITGFSKQFETLRNVSNEGRTMDFSNASSDVNMPKNRYKDILPNNHMRVRLKPSAAHGSDYINASFIEGYRQKGAYIATQGPLPNTVNDFWRMIWEHEVKCIVMLNQTEEKRQEVCHRYWPLGRGSSEAFGKYLVTLTSQENNNDYIIRKMDICENQSRISVSQTGFTITQIQYLKWPEDSVPQTTAAVLEIANLVQKVQMGSGNKAIVVMCNNGIGRSGAFICVHSQMERMKAEAMVDIFQFIKAVRIQRAGLVTSKEQYEFCHHVLADFLDGFDTYANFKEIV